MTDINWYIVNVIAGQENNVCNEINLLSKKYQDAIKDTFVPLRNAIKHIRGKKVNIPQKVFPNYVFIRMKMNPDMFDIIRSIPRVLNFLGSDPKKPEVVPDEDVEKIKKQIEEKNGEESIGTYKFGDMINITSGSFESFSGTVESFDAEKNMLRVSILVFNRPTIIDVDLSSVEKIN